MNGGVDCTLIKHIISMRNKNLNIILLSCTKFGGDLANKLIKNGYTFSCIFSTPIDFDISYSEKPVKNYNFFNFNEFCKTHSIKYYEINKATGQTLSTYNNIIKELEPDIILVLGWYYMVPKKIRDLAKKGAWGIHASLLPNYAGGAPLVWAIISGEKETGVTLFQLSDGVDDGNIIEQRKFSITELDSISSVYKKATKASELVLIKAMKNFDSVKFHPQDKGSIKVYPQRAPSDGEINLNLSAKEMYDFVRAQSSPYPGAFIKTVDNKKLIIEKARIEDI